SGTHLAWRLARDYLPEDLKIEAVSGRLIDEVTFRGIHYRTRAFHLTVNEGQLRWTPWDILRDSTLDIALIAMRGIDYTQLGTTPKPKEKSAPTRLPRRIDLPLDVRLDALRLRNVQYRSAPDAEPVELRGAVLSATYIGDRLTISRLAFDAPLLSLDGRARIITSHAYPLTGKFNWQGRQPDYPPVNGHTMLDGSLRELRIRQAAATPYKARARVVVSHPLKRLEFDAELNVKNLKLETIDKKLPPITLRLTAHATGVPNDLKLYAQATAHDPKYGTLNLAFEGGLAKQIATINRFQLSSSERPTRLEAAGQIALQGKQSQVDFNAHWQQLRWPLSGNPQFASGKGHIRVEGDIAALSAQLSADISGTALAQARIKKAQTIEANFSGGFANKTKTLTIDKLAVALSEQRLLAQGRVLLAGKQPEIRMRAHWRHVRWPLAGQPQIMSPKGAIKVSGTLSNLKAKLDVGVGEDGRIEANARRAGDNIKLALDWRKLRWPLTDVAKVKSSRG
ncbi:MAG TPA: hypothetical protein VHK27_06030, partial [Gammaproteobacteria bacterium]|nr:hypothetical protein [Gammaproteobacteria bacterium]